jgi:small subunit ribosomal protein S1
MAAKEVDKAQSPEYAELQKYLDELENPPRTFRRGQIITGKVVAVGSSEMVVDVGGRTEGVVSGKEMKLEGEKLEKKPGDDVLVYILKPENDKGQIELSIRRTGMARKWHQLRISKEENKPIEVTVIEANTGGVIVEISGGMRGFIPSSQLDNNRIYPSGGFKSKDEAAKQMQGKLAELIGVSLEAVVMEIDREKSRVILSEKNVGAEKNMEERRSTLERVEVGSKLTGEVTGIAPFGLFVIAESLEGLVHLSEISWDKVTNPADFYNVGDKVEVEVIGIDDGGKRIAYSIKRLQSDPWDEIIRNYKIGQVIKGEITKIVDYGAFVRVDEGLNGLIHISELSNKLVKDPSEVVKEGQAVDVMIISMSKDERHLGLSIRRLADAGSSSTAEQPVAESKSTGTEVAPEMARLEEILAGEEE